jgi:hypothetical protein
MKPQLTDKREVRGKMYFTVPLPMLDMLADKIRLVSVNNFKASSQVLPSRDRTFSHMSKREASLLFPFGSMGGVTGG